jgi:hypothetical protein
MWTVPLWAGRPEQMPSFSVDRWRILGALNADLRVAGDCYRADGGYADFHALRYMHIKALAKRNGPFKVVQTPPRNFTPVMALGVCTHLGLYDQASALYPLPDLTKPAPRSTPSTSAATPAACKIDRFFLNRFVGRAATSRKRTRPAEGLAHGSIDAIVPMMPVPNRTLAGRDTTGPPAFARSGLGDGSADRLGVDSFAVPGLRRAPEVIATGYTDF